MPITSFTRYNQISESLMFFLKLLNYSTQWMQNNCVSFWLMLLGYVKTGYKTPDPREGYMHCDVIVLGRNDFV